MRLARMVAGALRVAGFTEVFTARPAAWAHPEPTVALFAAFGCLSRQSGEERGQATVEVRVVRDGADAALAAAAEAERAVRRMDRASIEGTGMRVLGVDTRAPVMDGIDGSGRAVARVDVLLTIAREI